MKRRWGFQLQSCKGNSAEGIILIQNLPLLDTLRGALYPPGHPRDYNVGQTALFQKAQQLRPQRQSSLEKLCSSPCCLRDFPTCAHLISEFRFKLKCRAATWPAHKSQPYTQAACKPYEPVGRLLPDVFGPNANAYEMAEQTLGARYAHYCFQLPRRLERSRIVKNACESDMGSHLEKLCHASRQFTPPLYLRQ